MKVQERLINYVTVRTPSNEESEMVPSSTCQFDLARKLEKEMKELGLTEVVLDDSVICMVNFRQRKERKISRHLDLLRTWIQYLISVIMRYDR